MRDLTKYIGIPFVDKGKDPATGLDCWQLVRHFYAQEFGTQLPDYLAFYNSSLNILECSDAMNRARPEWTRVDVRNYGDVLVFRIMHAPWHTAVCLDGGLMLHTDAPHGSVIEKIDGLKWRDRFYGAYQWKS